MELTTVNKLYLELAQFATTKTETIINLECVQKVNNRRFQLLADILECDEAEHLPAELKERIKEEVFHLLSRKQDQE
jgi:hypothetical protein